MNRRDFLKLTRRRRVLDVSCESLFMHYVNSKMEGRTAELLDRTRAEFGGAVRIRLHDSSWLDRDELGRVLEPVLNELRSSGRHIEYV